MSNLPRKYWMVYFICILFAKYKNLLVSNVYFLFIYKCVFFVFNLKNLKKQIDKDFVKSCQNYI